MTYMYFDFSVCSLCFCSVLGLFQRDFSKFKFHCLPKTRIRTVLLVTQWWQCSRSERNVFLCHQQEAAAVALILEVELAVPWHWTRMILWRCSRVSWIQLRHSWEENSKLKATWWWLWNWRSSWDRWNPNYNSHEDAWLFSSVTWSVTQSRKSLIAKYWKNFNWIFFRYI